RRAGADDRRARPGCVLRRLRPARRRDQPQLCQRAGPRRGLLRAAVGLPAAGERHHPCPRCARLAGRGVAGDAGGSGRRDPRAMIPKRDPHMKQLQCDALKMPPLGGLRRRMACLAAALALGFGVAGAMAQDAAPTPWNPKPAEGDLVLPMPDGAEMAFRRIPVPGEGFWGDRARIIQLGDASGGIFEGLQRTQVSGSFPAAGGKQWEIVLAKYEITRGQFVAVMGMDALLAASGDPEDQKLPTLQGRAQRDALMKPLAFVSHQDVLDFMRRYNQWLFDPAHPERVAALPKSDGAPGFIRLPTEEEWEYAARGGLPAIEAGRFDDRLPIAAGEINEHAWHLGNARHQLRPVGLRAAGP